MSTQILAKKYSRRKRSQEILPNSAVSSEFLGLGNITARKVDLGAKKNCGLHARQEKNSENLPSVQNFSHLHHTKTPACSALFSLLHLLDFMQQVLQREVHLLKCKFEPNEMVGRILPKRHRHHIKLAIPSSIRSISTFNNTQHATNCNSINQSIPHPAPPP